MDYQLSITNDEINQLPLYQFSGEVTLVENEADAVKAALKLKGEGVLGFDTETRAAFKKGETYSVSLLQLATDKEAYLFRLNKFNLIKELVEILENPNVVKTGVAVRDDVKALQKLAPFTDSNFVDLAVVAKEKKIMNFGLRALTGIFLGHRLSKKAKISNWERSVLTPVQVDYAACDAVVGFEIYQRLCLK